MIAGLAIYPLGLDTKFVRHYCSSARMYDAGDCQIGWSYLLGIVGTSLAIFTPFLSQYTDLNLQETPDNDQPPQDGKHKPTSFV
ncbi:hypothetical protein LSH36_469g00028 [Paralvinella palmiformis]|uniref:Transmembrane protein 211 n=1 Tax=Paralvinella palmiformis TaxID=53620 RepID=A0AAD9JB60_9ANNE|nr:hypothetical protein LSH36_469g00028 [Paralvinella palmiformis]